MYISVIVRDGMGEVKATLSAPEDHIIEFNIVEAFAALRAINFCRELGFYRVILEGDALQVMQVLNKDGKIWYRYGHCIEKARRALTCLQRWNVNHILRHINGKAHCITKEALLLRGIHGLIEEIPNCILELSL
jgi:hypothetical protein